MANIFSLFSTLIILSLFTIFTLTKEEAILISQKSSEDISVFNSIEVNEDVNASDYSRILLGKPSQPFPFMAVIVRFVLNHFPKIICGATVLDQSNLLTAAHCIRPIRNYLRQGQRIEVWLGGNNLDKVFGIFPPSFEQKIRLDANQLFEHPMFTDDPLNQNNNYWHDVAVVGLSNQIRFTSKVQRICVGMRDYDGRSVKTIGYGQNNCVTPSKRLLEASGSIVNQQSCIAAGHPDNLLDSQVCARFGLLGLWGTQYPGPGDSGGPLFVEDGGQFVQVGITSYGQVKFLHLCPLTTIPATFTRAGAYRDFILQYATSACFV